MIPALVKGSGVAIAFPDVSKTPAPGGPIPVPYPNIGTYEVKNTAGQVTTVNHFNTGSHIPLTSGDEAGTVSSANMGRCVGNIALLRRLVDKAQANGSKVFIEVKGYDGQAVISLQGANRTPRVIVAHSGTEGMERLLMDMA